MYLKMSAWCSSSCSCMKVKVGFDEASSPRPSPNPNPSINGDGAAIVTSSSKVQETNKGKASPPNQNQWEGMTHSGVPALPVSSEEIMRARAIL